MVVSIIALFICISIASFLTQKFNFKQESSVAITFLGIALLLYISGLFNLMKFAVYAIYIISILSTIYTIYCLFKKKIKVTQLITPGIIFYMLAIIFMTFIVSNTQYLEWDEFSHWGANLKAMVQYDVFWSNNIYDGVHVVYTPLAGLIEYFFCKINGGFSEPVSYIAINFFITTLLLPICKNEKYNLKGFIKLALFWIIIYVTIILCHFSMASIYIDLLLGILFASGMFLAFRSDGKEDLVNLLLIMISMPLLKDSGLLLLGIILMTLFFNKIVLKIIEEKKITKDSFKKLGILILILVLALSLYGTWKIYCSANNRYLDDRHDKNAISTIDVRQFVKGLLLYDTEDSKYHDIANAFYNNFNTGLVVGQQESKFTTLTVFVVLNILGFLLYLIEQDKTTKKKILSIILAFNIGFILYCLLLLATFMFAFTEQEGRTLASYPRYMSTYFIAWIITWVGIGINSKSKNQIIIALISLLLCIYPINVSGLIDFHARKKVSGITEEIINEANIIKSNVNLNDKVYLIYQNDGGGLDYHMLRYSISPIVTNLMYEWSLGPKYNDNDIWSYDITKEEFVQKLINENFDYVFIAKIDKQFIDIYGDLIEGNYNENNFQDLENKLLKINPKDNTVTLSLVK